MIGRMMGDRDHTTVMHGVRKIDANIAKGGIVGLRALALKARIELALQ
jgi:chromosomal replication initiation ATPase DnaA